MNRLSLLVLLTLSYAVAQTEDEPLVALELSAEALAQHLGVKSWAFTYAHEGNSFQVGLFYYKRMAGALEGRYLTSLSAESSPSGQQRIIFIIG